MESKMILKAGFSEVEFDPEHGFSLTRLRYRDWEIKEFAKIIGPHFGKRIPEILAPEARQEDGTDRFPHGTGRFAKWECKTNTSSITAKVAGKDLLEGIPLKILQGQDFTMTCSIHLAEDILVYDLSIVSESDSLIGLECTFPIETRQEFLLGSVKNFSDTSYHIQEISSQWKTDVPGFLRYPIPNQEKADFVFHPFQALKGMISYHTSSYRIQTSYESESQELSWHLAHDVEPRSVSISPVSSQNPWRPNLTVSAIRISIGLSNDFQTISEMARPV